MPTTYRGIGPLVLPVRSLTTHWTMSLFDFGPSFVSGRPVVPCFRKSARNGASPSPYVSPLEPGWTLP